MNIISYTMVNNESEVIESFIRYNYNFVDQMVIIDNGCTDNTITIIRKLIAEGYNIKVYDESLETYNQFRIDNKYINIIIKELNPDIILPLDADEFISGSSNPREILENLDLNSIYYIPWKWYVLTPKDDKSELFVPKRLTYCLERPPYDQTNGEQVTKVIIPAKYYSKLNLVLSAGHHSVFGNNNVNIKRIDSLFLAHYRIISEEQFSSKIMCYVMRGIASMELTTKQTSHRTNQLSQYEESNDLFDTAEKVSYGGYNEKIIKDPINLEYCKEESLTLQYTNLSNETITQRVLRTGQEMAIKTYNSERKKKEKKGLKPVILWLDGVIDNDIIIPDPSKRSLLLTNKYNVRGYLTNYNEVKFLKANFRLITTADWINFLPHEYIIVPNGSNVEDVRHLMKDSLIPKENIISEREYKRNIGIHKVLWSNILLVPSLIGMLLAYIKRNGISGTINKIRNQFGN